MIGSKILGFIYIYIYNLPASSRYIKLHKEKIKKTDEEETFVKIPSVSFRTVSLHDYHLFENTEFYWKNIIIVILIFSGIALYWSGQLLGYFVCWY